MTDESDDQIGTDHLRAIGEITVNFSYLEAALSVIIFIFSGLESRKTVQMFTSKLSFRHKVDVLEALVVELMPGEDRLKEMKSLKRRAERAERLRNKYIHSAWGADFDPKRVRRMKGEFRHGFKMKAETLTVRELDAFASRLLKLGNDFLKFHWKLL